MPRLVDPLETIAKSNLRLNMLNKGERSIFISNTTAGNMDVPHLIGPANGRELEVSYHPDSEAENRLAEPPQEQKSIVTFQIEGGVFYRIYTQPSSLPPETRCTRVSILDYFERQRELALVQAWQANH
jgi:hypothetical protein